MKEIVEVTKNFLSQHIEEFVLIDSDFPGGSWNKENFLSDLNGKWDYSLALIINGAISGFILASNKTSHIHIHRFTIHNDLRSRGLGPDLLRAFEKKCKQFKTNSIGLNVGNANTKAQEFYLRNGFSIHSNLGLDSFFIKNLKKTVAIHQPNLFPWLGFFDKINKADDFIVLDHVLNRPNDAIYTKRVTILNNKLPYWLTIPLLKPKGIEFLKISEMKINLSDDFNKKHLKTIELNYKKTPYFDKIFPFIKKFYQSDSDFISKRNIDFIQDICESLKIKTPFYFSSELNSDLSATELLIDLTKKIEGEVYLAGGGATGYQEDQLFADSGLKLAYQEFKHPEYRQINSSGFVAGLSVIDCLMNIGFEGTKELLTFNNSI